jgi:uncharacterized protein
LREPVEGTILTMIRELAAEAAGRTTGEPAALFAALVARGEMALARTQELLPILREAGVVDAGAAGLLELVRGIAAAVAGESLPEPAAVEELSVDAVHRERSRFRYCTLYAVEGTNLDARALEQRLAPLGDSLLVVGDSTLLKVHVHTDDPGAALSAGTAVGVVDGVAIANMHHQTEQREQRLLHEDEPERATAVVAVVVGDGNARLFRSLGAAATVDGGQTMNPSAEQILAALEQTTAPEALVLPNNGNVILAARQAVGLATKPARVVPTRSLQEGLAALVAYDAGADAAANEEAMTEAAAAVAWGAITVAARRVDLSAGSLAAGQYLGLVAGEPVNGGDDFTEVAAGVVAALVGTTHDVLTLLAGEEAPPLDALLEVVAERHPDVEVEVHEGGQPHYLLLVAAE